MLENIQSLIIVLALVISTFLTRFLPFLLFRKTVKKGSFLEFLSDTLPYASIGFLVVYCLKEVSFISGTYGFPEMISIIFIILIHYNFENVLLSIGLGTAIYMLLIQIVF